MWSPNNHLLFPTRFQDAVKTMIMASRRTESLMYLLQDEIVLFIMNKCHWDDFGRDAPGGVSRADSDEAGGSSSSLLNRGARGGLSMSHGLYRSSFGAQSSPVEPTEAMRTMCEEMLTGHFSGVHGLANGWDSDSDDDDEYEELEGGSFSSESGEDEDEEDQPVVVDLD